MLDPIFQNATVIIESNIEESRGGILHSSVWIYRGTEQEARASGITEGARCVLILGPVQDELADKVANNLRMSLKQLGFHVDVFITADD